MSKIIRKLVLIMMFFGTTGTLFAQDSSSGGGTAGLIGMAFSVIWLVLCLAIFIGIWKVFTKAGQPGWAIIIPIYNAIVLIQIAKKPVWWIVLFFIPFVNIIVGIILAIEIAKAFGKGAGFGLGLAFFPMIFYPVLGFGSAEYIEG